MYKTNLSVKNILLTVLFIFAAWLLSGFYKVSENERAVVLRFGKYTKTTAPGVHYHLPFPFETVLKTNVQNINKIDIGLKSEYSLITGDENIVNINFSVLWKINDSVKYLFSTQNPELIIKEISESAIREVIAKSNMSEILTEGREYIQVEAKAIIQQKLDNNNTGILVIDVLLQNAQPPKQVLAAFIDVQSARADKEILINEAEAYVNIIVPKARGKVSAAKDNIKLIINQLIEDNVDPDEVNCGGED